MTCPSAQSGSDALAVITQTAVASGTFTAHVTQTTPSAVDDTFTAVTASWSGDFFNFDDSTSLPPYTFHLLAGDSNSPSNMEVYTTDFTGGPVNVAPLNCVIESN